MNDLKFAFRQLLKNPGFTAVAVLALGIGEPSKQRFELLNREAGILGNFAHGESVDWIVSRDYNHPRTVAHHRMFSFTDDLETCFLQRANGCPIVNAWQLGHKRSDGDDLAGDFGSKSGWQFGTRLEVFANRVADVGQSFFARGALAATTWKFITPNGKSFFGFDERYRVVHGLRVNFRDYLSSF